MDKGEDLSKMKVADLKKQLRSRGLAVTGNKTELVERLQEALDSGVGDAGAEPDLDTTEGEGMEDDDFDEEEILGGEEVDIGKITPQEEAAALGVKDADEVVEKRGKKKISLKRSEPCLSNPVETTTTTTTTTTEDTSDTTKANSESTTADSTADKENSNSSDEPKHKVIKLSSGASDAAVTDVSTKKLVIDTKSEEGRKEARAARFGVTATNANSAGKPSKLSMETGGTDLEKLKKRAERFGEVTSKSLSKLDALEKLNKRKDRFGSSDSSTDEAKIKVAKVSDKVQITLAENGSKTPSTNEVDLKSKRAERFKL